MVDFSQLKKQRKTALQDLAKQISDVASGSRTGGDARFWKPTRDKAGNGFAIIRFLPASPGEEIPYVRVWSHFFKGPGGVYAENSLTTLGQEDPVSELNTKLWNSGSEADKQQARKQKRKLEFISNIYVIKDSANPEAEGKNFLYRYGKKIFDKINDKANPAAEFEDEEPVNPFDFWEGANFRLKIRTVEEFPNYDKSEFDSPSALLGGDDEKLEKLWKSLHSLKEFNDPSNFKTYAELDAKLKKVLALDETTTRSRSNTPDRAVTQPASLPETKAPWESTEGDEDDNISFLRNLAKDDD